MNLEQHHRNIVIGGGILFIVLFAVGIYWLFNQNNKPILIASEQGMGAASKAVLGSGDDVVCNFPESNGKKVTVFFKDNMFRQEHFETATGNTSIILGARNKIYMYNSGSGGSFVFDLADEKANQITKQFSWETIQSSPIAQFCTKTSLSDSVFDAPQAGNDLKMSDISKGQVVPTQVIPTIEARFNEAGQRVEQSLNDANERTKAQLEFAGAMTRQRLEFAGALVEAQFRLVGSILQGIGNAFNPK